MKIKILLLVLSLFSMIYSQSLYAQVHVCKNDSANLDVTIINQTSELSPSSTAGLFRLVLLDDKRNVKYEHQTLVSWPFLESLGENTVIEDLECAGIEWLPPYSRDISFFQLYKTDGNKLLLEAPLNFCNLNNICDPDENGLSCPEDCIPDYTPPPTKPIWPSSSPLFSVLLVFGFSLAALAIILLILYLFFIRKKGEGQK